MQTLFAGTRRAEQQQEEVLLQATSLGTEEGTLPLVVDAAQLAAVRLRLPSEGGETYSGTALTYVAVPATVAVAILVEPLALLVAGSSGWRAAAGRFGRCVLRFLVGFLLWTLLLQVIDR